MCERKVIDCIYNAIEQFNQQEQKELPKSLNTKIYGRDGNLDSIDLVNFITLVEENIEKSLSYSLILADEKALSYRSSPFYDITTLKNFVLSLIKEQI